MQQAFWILPLLYFGAVVIVTVLAVVLLLRITKAQEASARALADLADAVARLRPPA